MGWTVLQPDSVRASSFIRNPRQRDSHPPEHAFDGDPSTAWNEGAPGPGDGEWIEARYRQPVRVRRIRIATGWDASSARHGDLFPLNSHLRLVQFTTDGGFSRTVAVAEGQREVVVDHLNLLTQRVRVTAVSVWPGSHWADLCISEGTIEGPPLAPTEETAREESTEDDATGSADCTYQTHESFHLRPAEARTRVGSQLIDSNPSVQLLRRGALARGSEASFFVRLLDGSQREGWMFVPRAELPASCL